MNKIILMSLLLVFFSNSQSLAQNNSGFDKSWDQRETVMRPYGQDQYGPGIHSDAAGKPFTWQTNDGQTVPPGVQVKPDGYGLGVGQDQFGRPVKPKTWP